MTDIARLGFAADTSDLKEAKASLEALVPAAKRAETAARGVTAAANGLAGGIKPFNTAVQQAASGSTGLSRAALASSTAMGTVQRAAVGASAEIATLGVTVSRVGMNFAQADAHVEAYKRSLAGIAPAAESARSSIQRMGAAANDNINAMQATPGNIAAQFQDIGVTAAAGMNPMIIALQQGTQLSAAMSGGLGNLVKGLAQVFSATTLLTIGLVGLIAAGIQMVDWAEAGAWVLNTLADAMVPIAPYAVGIAAAFTLLYSPAIVRGIWSIATAFYGLAASMIACLGLPGLIILGLTAIIAAANHWRDDLTKILGVDIVEAAKGGINWIVGSFVGAFDAVVAVWDRLDDALGDAAYRAANRVRSEMNSLFTLKDEQGNVRWQPFSSGSIANPYAGALEQVGGIARGRIASAREVDYVGGGVDWIQRQAGIGADWLRGIAGSMTAAEPEKGKTDRAARGRREKTNDELFAEVIEGAEKQMRALQNAGAQIGVYGEALERLKFEQQLFNDAQDRGVVLTDAMSDELKRRAAEMASLAQDNAISQFNEDMRRDHEETMWSLGRERGEIGLTAEALEAYRIETELLAEARRQNLDLNPSEIAALQKIAREQAATAEAIRKTKEALGEARETARGFFRDWYDGILAGRGLFGSFVDAVVGGLQRIAEKMMDRAIEKFLDMMFSGSTGSSPFGGGIFGSVLDAVFGNNIAEGEHTTAARAGLPPDPFTVFGTKVAGTQGGPKGFALGGAFTNSIVTRPTLFTFAKGTALGEMGEAGPEAILPLKRGPDGSLGVQGGGSAGNTYVNDVKVDNHFTVSGAVTPADIMRAIRAGSEETQQEVKRQLMGWLQEIQADGGTV
jgi:hypothetical protein